jgi:cytoskeletal protein RodZ
MQTIGERLEEARKRLGVSLREASEATKIRMDYLQEMENGSFAFPLPDVYKRGFLKIYARHLKLDAEKLGTDFNAQSLASSRLARRDHLGRVELPGREAEAEAEGGAPARPASAFEAGEMLDRKTLTRLAGMLVAAIVILVVLFYGVEKLLRSDAGTDTASSASLGTPPPASPTTDAPATTEPAAPALHLILSATDDISLLTVKQVSNRSVLFNGALPKGQQVDLSPDGRVEITVTNAENLHIDQNGALYALKVSGLQDFYWPTKKMENAP